MRSHTFAAVLLACLLTACATPRSYVEISGSVVLFEEQPLPDDYRIFIEEYRRPSLGFLGAPSRPSPAAALEIAADGTFSFAGYLCDRSSIYAPYIHAQILDGSREVLVHIEISERDMVLIDMYWRSGETYWAEQREAAEQFHDRLTGTRYPVQIPC